MTLTNFVSNESVRNRLDETFPNQGDRASRSVQVEAKTTNHSQVGTALDYLVRFWLRRNSDEFHAGPWAAEHGLTAARKHQPQFVQAIEGVLETAKDRRDTYLDTGTVTRPLVESALDLAKVDTFYRSGYPPDTLGEYTDDDIVDCLELLELVDTTGVLDGSEVYLNPTFGIGSELVSGADGDIIVDGTLVDVKVTKKSTFSVSYWRQLVGYLMLADIHSRFDGTYDIATPYSDPETTLPEITDFGVYFARQGELSAVPASTVYEADGYEEAVSWFIETALDEYLLGDPQLEDDLRDLY